MHCLPMFVHRQIVEIKDAGVTAIATTRIQVGTLGRLRHRI